MDLKAKLDFKFYQVINCMKFFKTSGGGKMARSAKSLLSDKAILKHMEEGNIVIDPFDKQNLGTCSYDVSLGKFYFREQHHGGGFVAYNMYSENEVKRVWGQARKAEKAKDWMKKQSITELNGISPHDLIIWIEPGETILCHTNEFIGGLNCVTTMMKARSSLGRNFIEICKCAGWGDVGFINRWTMEVTNNSRYYQIPLVVGRRIAQIVFFEVQEIEDKQRDYSSSGKYQSSADINAIKQDWVPETMLPKMFKDREAVTAQLETQRAAERVRKGLTDKCRH